MRVLKVRLKQNQAHYRKEESSKNKMTYPLPPVSTVIGAIHSACGFTSYKPMDISIQGRFKSMYNRPYTDYCFLNSIMDDRGILVKFPNGRLMSNAHIKVGSAKKSQGNSFRKQITIDVHNKQLMDEYISLREISDEIGSFEKTRIKKFKESIKLRKKSLGAKKKFLVKKSKEYELIVKREKELKVLEKLVLDKVKEYKEINVNKELSKYASLTTSLKYYEILTDVELVLHISASDEVLKEIEENIYSLRAIGRSEDSVEVVSSEMVDLRPVDKKVKSKYSAYITKERVDDYDYDIGRSLETRARGTRYKLNKNYKIEKNQRIFEKVEVLYTSRYSVFKGSEWIFLDDENLIVDLL